MKRLREPVDRRSIPRRLRDAFAAAQAAGWHVERCGGKHLRWVPAERSARIVITSSSPSDGRATRNALADLRRSGLSI